MVDQATSDAAMARLAEHLQHLANMLIDAGSALPDGEPCPEQVLRPAQDDGSLGSAGAGGPTGSRVHTDGRDGDDE